LEGIGTYYESRTELNGVSTQEVFLIHGFAIRNFRK
jgi:hypothetical protein